MVKGSGYRILTCDAKSFMSKKVASSETVLGSPGFGFMRENGPESIRYHASGGGITRVRPVNHATVTNISNAIRMLLNPPQSRLNSRYFPGRAPPVHFGWSAGPQLQYFIRPVTVDKSLGCATTSGMRLSTCKAGRTRGRVAGPELGANLFETAAGWGCEK